MSTMDEIECIADRIYEDAMDEFEAKGQCCDHCGYVNRVDYMFQCPICGRWVCGDCVCYINLETVCPKCSRDVVIDA